MIIFHKDMGVLNSLLVHPPHSFASCPLSNCVNITMLFPQGVLKARIIAALQELNKEWSFSSCNQLTEEDCEDLGININCNRR